ncbi:MAG TPA: DMT family transporter [Thermoanaerobaculia bacterium]|nr:DMT family transporter [Thermoanaerobaculia bacterium]
MTGQLAALGAASLWACTALAIESAARRIGSLSVNLIRLAFALAFFSLAGVAMRGLPFPSDATPHNWLWLTASGLVGFTFGDLCLYRAYLVLGPRLSSVMMALVPPITALIGWTLLDETLTPRDLLGMTLTVAGISWAILERGSRSGTVQTGPVTFWGVALGIGAALGQALGLILSKIGMAGYDAVAATQVRVIAGLAGFALLFFPLRWWSNVRTSLRDRKALGWAALGGFFGPFLAVSLSLIAIRETVAGVAASIMALTPVLIIPLVVVFQRERVGWAGVAAALIAVTGVALLFL